MQETIFFANVSLFGWVQYITDVWDAGDYAVGGSVWEAYVAVLVIFVAPGVLALLCLLFALIRRATPLIVCGLLAVGSFWLVVRYFDTNMNANAYEWSVALWAYLAGFAVALLGAIILFCERHSERKVRRAARAAGRLAK